MNKYGAKKCVVDGYTFDSGREASKYRLLVCLERTGEIFDLQLQPVYELAPSVRLNGRKKPPLRYIADFSYWCEGSLHVVDVKGVSTVAYRIKKHLMKSVHGIEVEEA